MKNSVSSDLTVMGLSIILFVGGWLFNINVNMHRYYPHPKKNKNTVTLFHKHFKTKRL